MTPIDEANGMWYLSSWDHSACQRDRIQEDKIMKRKLFVVLILSAALASGATTAMAQASSYNYIKPAELKARLEAGDSLTVVDIQVEEEFNSQHIRGALPTYAYPVKTETQRAKVDTVYDNLAQLSTPVIIVCPRGGGGAKRTFDHLAGKGISTDRLLILESGQEGWPYPELLEK
jgi:rhodanese-related sulfurtransferase